jgi:hypothetical protein
MHRHRVREHQSLPDPIDKKLLFDRWAADMLQMGRKENP